MRKRNSETKTIDIYHQNRLEQQPHASSTIEHLNVRNNVPCLLYPAHIRLMICSYFIINSTAHKITFEHKSITLLWILNLERFRFSVYWPISSISTSINPMDIAYHDHDSQCRYMAQYRLCYIRSLSSKTYHYQPFFMYSMIYSWCNDVCLLG